MVDIKDLMEAVEANDMDAAKGILESGVSPNAIRAGDQSPLILACDAGNEPMVGLLIEWGADVNHQDDAGDSPLICASVVGSAPIVRMLIANDVNLDAVSRLKCTALKYAMHHSQEEVVELLLKAGATEPGDA